jgi:HEPN domain-containing protein
MNNYRNRKGQTLSMQWVIFLLQSVQRDISMGGEITRLVLNDAKSHGGDNDYNALQTGCTYTLNFLLPLTIELGLKALILKENNEPPKVHNLIKLHNNLTKETKENVQIQFRKLSEGDFKVIDLLEKHKNDFENWRYLDDPSNCPGGDDVMMQYLVSAILDILETN